MSSPKLKAKELVEKYYYLLPLTDYKKTIEKSKQCALIAVDEILKEHYPQDIKRCDYFMEVKQEIEKL